MLIEHTREIFLYLINYIKYNLLKQICLFNFIY